MLQLVFHFLNQLYVVSYSCVTLSKICPEGSECFPREDANGMAEISCSDAVSFTKPSNHIIWQSFYCDNRS